jgi:tetratricopeptide (TPR) repeat protein
MSSVIVPYACPSPSVLGAFAEGTLDEIERIDVVRHVADCEECAVVVGASVLDLQHESPQRKWRWLLPFAAGTMIAAVLLAVFASRDSIATLRAASAEARYRSTDGRLAGFAHRPFDDRRAGEPPNVDLEIRSVAERLSTAATDSHVKGVALLFLGKAADAERVLRLAAAAEPRNAACWNDLAVAELASGGRALAACDAAIAISPSLAAAHFNRAIALERLGRPAEAARAYRRSLSLETSPAWRKEIQERLDDLSQKPR